MLAPAGRAVEHGSLHKHAAASRKLGRQEGEGAVGMATRSLGLAPGKSKLKDKLSAIRQDRAERRESLQKQDAIHEVDSSEDETDDGSEDSQDGRRATAFTPPLLRPTSVRTGPAGTLPSLCKGEGSVAKATTDRPAQSAATEKPDSNGGVGTGSVPSSFSTPGSAFMSVSKPPPQADAQGPKPAVPPAGASPGVPKEQKEADNRRLCAAAATSVTSATAPAPPTESGMDRVVSQIATVAKSVLGPARTASPSRAASRTSAQSDRAGPEPAHAPADPPAAPASGRTT